jgi:cytochrome P450
LLADEATVIDYAGRVAELQRYLLVRAEERRAAPSGDMLSDLVTARIEGERPLDDAELVSILQQLLVAGNETTTSAIAAGMKILLDERDLRRRIAADPTNELKVFVEEVLRLESPVQGSLRRVTRDTVLGGVAIPAGALVQLRYGAANRDERVFDHGGCADLDRRNAGAHLAFGAGIHFCIGAMLARQELVSAFSALLLRLPNLRFARGRNDFHYHPSFYLRGLKALHLAFDPIV